MTICSSCGERPAIKGHDLCALCDEDALIDEFAIAPELAAVSEAKGDDDE